MNDMTVALDSHTVLNSIRERIARSAPKGWTLTTLGESFKWSSGGTPRRTEPTYFGGQIRWAVIGDLNDGVITETERTITESGLANSSAKWVEPGSVLVAMYGSIGKLGIAGRRLTTNQAIAFTNPDPVDAKYLYYFLLWQRPSLARLGKGATQRNISQTVLKEFPFLLAPAADQRRVVAEIEKQFSRLDEAVANLQQLRAKLKMYESGILREAAEGKFIAGSRNGWRTAKVCEAGDVLLGRQRAPQYLSGRYSRKYLRVANIKDDAIDFSDLETMDFDEAHFAKYQLLPGDILVSEGQSPELLGQSAIFHGYHEPVCFQKTLHRFRARLDITTPEFAQLVFRAHVRSGVFRRLGSITTNIAHLTLEKFREAPFPLPPLDEQRRIVAEVERQLSLVRGVEAEVIANLDRAKALRHAVLARAFGVSPNG